jgi:hypothetical protein
VVGVSPDRRTPEVEPWPVWLRGTLLAVLVVVIGIGVVVALYDRGWLPLTGPFVAALLVPLILRGRHYWLARRRRDADADAGDPSAR